MPLLELGVVDASRFPILSIDGATLAPGDGARIIDDLEALIRHGSAFVLIIDNGSGPQDRSHDEDKARMLWLKENRRRLAAVCRGIISVVTDHQRLALVQKQTTGLRTALGIHFAAVDSPSSAQALAAELMASGA